MLLASERHIKGSLGPLSYLEKELLSYQDCYCLFRIFIPCSSDSNHLGWLFLKKKASKTPKNTTELPENK